MSDIQTDRDFSVLCPICIETFRLPRSTTCKHSFCEQCLFTYVSTLKDKGELGSSFPCPVCRQDVTAPSDGNVSLSWIQTFPVNEELLNRISELAESKEDGKADESVHIICDPCAADEEQNKAVKFCIDCQENLCKTCVEVHRKYKTLKGHKLVENRTQGLANQLKEITVDIKCGKHRDKDVEIYCVNHDVYCCVTCARVAHRECGGIQEIADMEGVWDKTMTFLSQKYEIAEKHLEEVRTGHEECMSKLSDNIAKVQTLFKQKKDEIIRSLEDIQDELTLKAKQLKISTEQEQKAIIEKVGSMKLHCRQNIDKIDTLRQYGLPVHKVVTRKDLVDEYVRFERDMDTGEMNEEELDVKWPVLDQLADINKSIAACKVEVLSVLRKPGQIIRCEDILHPMKDKHVTKINEHTVSLVSKCIPTYTGVTMTESQQLLLCDTCGHNVMCGHVCLYDPKSNYKSISKLKLNKPFSAVSLKLKPTKIAVSVPGDKHILIISKKEDNTLSIVKTFQTDKMPYSLVGLDNGQLGVTWFYPPSFDIVDVSGKEMKVIRSYTQDTTGRTFKSFKCVAVDELRSHIVQPCTTEHAVYCFDFSGNPVFEYRDAELKSPLGVDIDRDGNIYICSRGTSMTHVLTPSGRKVKVIKEGVPGYPMAICFDETKDRFWVTWENAAHNRLCLFSCRD